MQICRFHKAFLISSVLFFSTCFSGFSEAMPEMPDFPDTLDFPTISPPSVGSGFYTPKVPYYPKAADTVKKSQNSAQSKTATGSTQTSSLQTGTLTDGNTQQDLLNSLLGANNFLTASDITSLANTGSFNTLSSLYSSSTDNVSTNTLLRQILTELEELKKKTNTSTQTTQNETFKTRDARILRFKINGYNILDSLSTVYFSQLENDGSFLLSGDRRYVADKKIHNETFYFLFKAKENSGSIVTYEVSPSIVQDVKNDNSFVYKVAHQKSLTAQKTGNLVVLRFDSKDCSGDLLLDLDI